MKYEIDLPDDVQLVAVQRFNPSSGFLSPAWTVSVSFSQESSWRAYCFGSGRKGNLQDAADLAVQVLRNDKEAVERKMSEVPQPKTRVLDLDLSDLGL